MSSPGAPQPHRGPSIMLITGISAAGKSTWPSCWPNGLGRRAARQRAPDPDAPPRTLARYLQPDSGPDRGRDLVPGLDRSNDPGPAVVSTRVAPIFPVSDVPA